MAIFNTRAPFVINFHGVGNPSRAYEPDEEPYWIDRVHFKNILDFVEQHPSRAELRLTFDDGNSSDYAIVAPELKRRGLGARFFVLAGKLGRKGYLSKAEVRDLSAQGFEIGSQGIDHVHWTDASYAALVREIKDSKAILEDVTGCSVRSAAVPFGLYDRRVLRELSRHGYQNVFSSDGGPRLIAMLPTPRYSVQRSVPLTSLASLIEASTSFSRRALTELRVLAKALVRRGKVP
jgi:peptidoglycan/xylan/chitin deacetylase (PgdA/CDA1 family)